MVRKSSHNSHTISEYKINVGICTARRLDCVLGPDDRDRLLAVYRGLPAFADVPAALAELAEAGFEIFAFSNGARQTVAALLDGAGVGDVFAEIIGVEAVASFKPDPAVYHYPWGVEPEFTVSGLGAIRERLS